MSNPRADRLLPMTILDGMVLVAGCAVSAWLLATIQRSTYVHPFAPEDLLDWLILTAFVQYGVTIVGPVLLAIQFLRGRKQGLMPGEIAWLVVGIELSPFAVVWATDADGPPASWLPEWFVDCEHWYFDTWLFHVSPPLVLSCAILAWAWHFLKGRPRYWSHRLGLGIALMQCVPSGLIMLGWFGGFY